MNKAQEEHSGLMARIFYGQMLKKYEAGTKEHSGHLWEVPGVLDMAIEETVDQANYLLTLKGQIREISEYIDFCVEQTNRPGKEQHAHKLFKNLRKKFNLLTDKPKG